MEKRFALFLVLSALILFAHFIMQSAMAPRRPAERRAAQHGEIAGGEHAPLAHEPPGAPEEAEPDESAEPADRASAETEPQEPAAQPEEPTLQAAPRAQVPKRRITLGSMAPDSPYRMLVTLNNQGAAVEYIELAERTKKGKLRYHELEAKGGYLGQLALDDPAEAPGARVNVVGPGTPAALAVPKGQHTEPGLLVGDVIRTVDGHPVQSPADFHALLRTTKPGQTIELTVDRPDSSGGTTTKTFAVTLTEQPLKIIQPEVNEDSLLGLPDPLSFLLTLETIGAKRIERGREELAIPSLRNGNWEVTELDDDGSGPAVEFRFRLSEDDLKGIGVTGALEVVKRYRLAPTPKEERTNDDYPSYNLTMEVEIRNVGATSLPVAYRLDGPNGLPLEGWWYSRKIHPTKFSSAGARDVVWSTPESGHGLVSTMKIYQEAKEAAEKNQSPTIPLFDDTKPHALEYVGVDTQYFTVALIPQHPERPGKVLFRRAIAMPAGDVGEKPKSKIRTTNVTFRLSSLPRTIEPGKAYEQTFVLFAGPKRPALLAQYGLDDCIAYGWFWWVAIPLSWILHLFESLPLVNYGLAIILLTVLVRSLMLPISRKATRNAQMMQELAPEMKRIAEKYKNDMEKRAAAQRELFAKHNYNPFGGCLLMFLQLPIFIGLYRELAVDIELRQAPLIPGISWCSNLAGPDMLFYWKDWMPAFLASETGWLGPYFNVLPIITIVLFLVQQKMFMPPATDEQTRMQQQVMKFMMIFMGFLFFRVASGLCVYFIASSLWGVAERKLLRPPEKGGKRPASKAPSKRKAEAELKRAKAKRKLRNR